MYIAHLGTYFGNSCLIYDNSNQISIMTYIIIENCTFSKNTASLGGAIYLRGLTNTLIEKSYFFNNRAIKSLFYIQINGLGGSIYSNCIINDKCDIIFRNSIFEKNNADSLGGGIFLQNYKISELFDNIFNNNSAVFLQSSNNSNMSGPVNINLTYIHVENEPEIYYNQDNQTDIITINNVQNIELLFAIYDSDNLDCSYDINAPATFTTNDSITLKDIRVKADKNGKIKFKTFSVHGRANETYILQMELTGNFNLKKYINLLIVQ